MKVIPIKSEIVRAKKRSLLSLLDQFVVNVPERSILAVTSKIVSLCEGRVMDKDIEKQSLIEKEADLFLAPEENIYGISMTIKRDLLIPAAGIDESNGGGQYVLWPRDPQKTANAVRVYLTKRFSLKYVGVLITDSKTTPLRWGTTGTTLAHSGFVGVNNYIGTPDLFGKKFEVTKVNVRDGLAASAVLVMGEAREQTPIALITSVPFVRFQDRDPTKKELEALRISMDEDLYGPILKRAPWKRGKISR